VIRRVRKRLSYANVTATVALFVALGGAAYAGSKIATSDIKSGAVTSKKLAKNAVRTKHIATKAVTEPKIANNAVSDRTIRNNAVGQTEIAAAAVGTGELADESVTSSKLAPIEDVHLVGGAGEPGFGAGFGNFGGVFTPVGFYKDPFGIVHLQGLASGPQTGTVFTLPDGYRPGTTHYMNVATSSPSSSGANYVGRLSIDTAGNVSELDGGGSFVSLENIEFRAGS
jgi:hypothetical protein